MSVQRFLGAIFAHHSQGFIEVRLIVEKRGGGLVAREFYPSIEALVADLDRLRKLAEARDAGIFYGVLPRRESGKGTARDVLEGLVAWCDIDFKDYPGGEADARARLEAFPVQPSIIVRSGHGLHAYWLLREPTDPQELSRISKGVARALSGDHAFDAARILRLPETYNRKDRDNPLPVEIEILDEKRACNVSEIEEALDAFEWSTGASATGDGPREAQDDPGDADIKIGTTLSDQVQALLHTTPRIQNLFWGRGRTPLGRDGRTLDASSSGYDFSLVLELRRRGIEDPSELATTLYLRPDEAAKAKGRRYIVRTVREALKVHNARHERGEDDLEPPPDPASQIDFVVEKIRIVASDPARYEMTIAGKPMQLTSAQLRNADRFELRYMDAHKRIPRLPDQGWSILVNDWLAGADVVEAPPEASTDLALAEAVEDAIRDLRLRDDPQDLHRGGACLLDPLTAFFRLGPFLKVLKEDYPNLTRPQVALALRDLGWQPRRVPIDGREVRGWAGPAADVRCAREDSAGAGE